MQLNELIEKEGLESVSNKTNISIENLENLQNEVFQRLNRVKSLGFINILEREYNLELDEMREKIKVYFDDHHTAKDDEVVMLSPDRVEESGISLFKWLVVAALLYGFWHLYNTGKFDKLLGKVDNKELLLADHKALESNATQTEAEHVVVNIKNKEESVVIDTSKQPLEKVTKDEVAKDNKVVKGEKEEQKVESETLNKESKKIEESSDNPQKEESKKEVVESLLEEVSDANQSIDTQEEEKAKIIYNLTVNPTRGMLWYGFINIDTKERREFMKKTSTPFELDGGRWILVTGHGYLEIVSDISTVKVTKNIRKKHYFYLDSSEIKEIDRKEFVSLNGGRGW
jgi:hypothetical protein